MPDYNPAIALGIQPPPQINVGQALSQASDYQRAQAATQLSQLQALQVQRKYNGLMAFNQSLANNPKDVQGALHVGLAAGGDPQEMTAGLGALSTANFVGSHNGLNAEGATANATIARTGAEITKLGAETKGINIGNAAKIAAPVIADPKDDGAWKTAVNAHYDSVGGSALEKQHVLGVTDPATRLKIAQQYSYQGVSPDEFNKPQTVSGTDSLMSPAERAAAKATALSPGQAQGTTQPLGQPPAQQRIPGVSPPMSPGEQEQQKLTYQRSEQMYGGLRSQSSQYENDRPLITLAKSVLSNPDMYTGVGANAVLNFNKVKAAFGDTKAAMLQEALEKVTATNVLGQLNQQREELQGGGINGGRIFAPMVDLVSKASAQGGTTLAGNRLLMEIMDRKGQLNTKLRDMAADYRNAPANHGLLDSGFDTKVSQYLKNNPVFTDQELAHPELIGAPNAPAGLSDTQSRKAWIQGMGLHPGDPVRVNGQYKYLGQQ